MFTGPNIVRDGLVLHLDAANEKSFRGEPTTNFANTDTLRTFIEHSPGAYGNDSVMSDAPEKGIGWKKITVLNRGNNFRIAQLPYLTQLANTTRTYSIEIDFGNTSGYFIRGDGTIGFGSNGSSNGIYTATVSPTASNRSLALFLNHNTTGVSGISDVIYYRNYQVEEKSYATPFTESNRGTTVATGGGWADKSGNNNHGELINGVTYSSSSLGNLVFNGIDGTISFSSNNLLNTPDGFTAEVWAKFNNSSAHVLIHKDSVYSIRRANSTTLQWADGTNWSYANWGNTSPSFTYNTSNTNKFYQIVATKSGSLVSIYLDGILIVQKTFGSTGVGGNTNPLYIGSYAGSSNFLNGSIATTRVYNKALTAEEVLQNYEATKSRFGL